MGFEFLLPDRMTLVGKVAPSDRSYLICSRSAVKKSARSPSTGAYPGRVSDSSSSFVDDTPKMSYKNYSLAWDPTKRVRYCPLSIMNAS